MPGTSYSSDGGPGRQPRVRVTRLDSSSVRWAASRSALLACLDPPRSCMDVIVVRRRVGCQPGRGVQLSPSGPRPRRPRRHVLVEHAAFVGHGHWSSDSFGHRSNARPERLLEREQLPNDPFEILVQLVWGSRIDPRQYSATRQALRFSALQEASLYLCFDCRRCGSRSCRRQVLLVAGVDVGSTFQATGKTPLLSRPGPA